jgi:hypothetical protein
MTDWTEAMVAMLQRMRAAGCSDAEIGLALCLAAGVVRAKRLQLEREG